jgi:hypothetical protein
MNINVTQDALNSLLLNTTLSIMSAYGLWSTQSNATVRTTINVFSLSRPLNLFVPYLLALGLAVPFLIIGIIALVRNGVSAMDGSFLQLLTTTTGSAALNGLAASGCLGGAENVPKDLMELRVRFGELIDANSASEDLQEMPARAGFGIEGEVIGLRKGKMYGVDREGSAGFEHFNWIISSPPSSETEIHNGQGSI